MHGLAIEPAAQTMEPEMKSTTQRKMTGNEHQPSSAARNNRDPNKDPSPSRQDSEPPSKHSPTGDPDERRDDDVEPSPEGPLGKSRDDDSDMEGLHEGGHENVERE
jgi:hypothetical protein